MTDCPAYPYGRFNVTSSNFKLFPRVNNIKHPNAEKIWGSSLMVYRNTGNNFIPIGIGIYRAVRNGEQSRTGIGTSGPIPGLSKPGNIYSNTAYHMTKAEKMAYLSKFSGANGLKR